MSFQSAQNTESPGSQTLALCSWIIPEDAWEPLDGERRVSTVVAFFAEMLGSPLRFHLEEGIS